MGLAHSQLGGPNLATPPLWDKSNPMARVMTKAERTAERLIGMFCTAMSSFVLLFSFPVRVCGGKEEVWREQQVLLEV